MSAKFSAEKLFFGPKIANKYSATTYPDERISRKKNSRPSPPQLPDAEERNRPPNRYEVLPICPKTIVYRGGVVAPKSCTRASEHRFDRKLAIGAHKHPRHQDPFKRIFWCVGREAWSKTMACPAGHAPPASEELSSGAIGGIVVGAYLGVAAIGGAVAAYRGVVL